MSLTVERELFGDEGGGTGRVTESIDANEAGSDERGAEQYLVELRECLLPLAERRGALMRDMLAALEVFQARSRRQTTAALEPMRTERDQLSQRRPDGTHSPTAAPPSEIRSTLRMSPMRLGQTPGRVCWRLCTWTIRATMSG